MATEPGGSRTATSGDLILLLALATLWGSSYSLIKLGVATIPPLTLIAGRTLIAAALLLGAIRIRRLPFPRDVAVWRSFAVQACLNSVVPFTLIAWAERTISVGMATILNSVTPIIVILLARLLARGDEFTSRKFFGVVAGLVGVTSIVGLDALRGSHDLLAEGAVLVATVCYGGAAIFGRTFRTMDPLLPAAGSLLCGTAVLVPLSLVVDRPWHLAPSQTSLIALVVLSILSTAVAMLIYFRLIGTLGSVATSAQAYLRVPVGIFGGMLLLGERPGLPIWIGCAAVVTGVAAMTGVTFERSSRARA